MIFHMLSKDIRRFKWPLTLWLLTVALPVLLGLADVLFAAHDLQLHSLLLSLGFGDDWIQWFLGIAMVAWVLQEETLVSDKAYWLTRPISGPDLAKAKGLFVAFFLVLVPQAAQVLALSLQGATAGELGWAALEFLLRQLEMVSLAALIAVITKDFGWFVPMASLAFFLQWLCSGWSMISRFLDKLSPAALKPIAMIECDSTLVALLTILGGCGLVVNQYRTRETGRTLQGALACLALMLLVQPFWRWDFQKPTLPPDPGASSLTLGLGKYSPLKESWPQSHDHTQCLQYVGNLQIKGGNPGDVFLPQRFRTSLVLPDGKTWTDDGYDVGLVALWESLTSQWAEISTSNGGRFAFLWSGVPDAEGIQDTLGKVRLVNPDRSTIHKYTMMRMDQGLYRKFFDRPLSFHADVDLIRYRYKVEGEFPLLPNAGFKEGARSVTIMEVNPQGPGLQVKLQSQCLDLAFGNDTKTRKLPFYGEDNVFYVLVNKKLGEAFLPEPWYPFFAVDLMEQKQPLRLSRDVLNFRTNEFNPVEKGHVLDHVWLQDAVLVRVRMEPLGQSTRPLAQEAFFLTGNGGKSLPLPEELYIGHGMGIPTIQGQPTPSVKPEPVTQGRKLTAPGPAFLVDDFEKGGEINRLGGKWYTNMDYNKLGTAVNPVPFKPQAGGCPDSPGHAAHLWGHMGKVQAPWVWAQIACNLDPHKKPLDLSGFSGIRFWEKGDGKPYEVIVSRACIKDSGDYRCTFKSTPNWTQVTIPFSQFQQPFWAKPIDEGWKDVQSLAFDGDGTVIDDEDLDFWIDQVELVK